jgi:hypothetical protein
MTRPPQHQPVSRRGRSMRCPRGRV